MKTIGLNSGAHPDFGSDPSSGIPINAVPGSQPKVAITFRYQSDPGPYPIPANPLIEGGSDRHILVVDTTACVDYEVFSAYPNGDGTWSAGSGAIFPFTSNALRPAGWTSADAAGLPILPGLVRYEEVQSGSINHALRFTAAVTDSAYIWPARHDASTASGTQYPPMGQRFRLKKTFDVSSFSPEVQVILNALKTYGMILADNGGPWFISGAPDTRWNDDNLHQLTQVLGSNFEAVDESALMVDPNSAQVASSTTTGGGSGFAANTWLRLVSKHSGKCVGVAGGASDTAPSAPMQQGSCAGSTNQSFEFVPVSGGYKITVQSSGLQLDVLGGPTAKQDGAPVIQYPYWGGSNEIWNIKATSDGYFTVSPVSSGKCLDVNGASTQDGAAVQQWTCTGGDNQKWQFVRN